MLIKKLRKGTLLDVINAGYGYGYGDGYGDGDGYGYGIGYGDGYGDSTENGLEVLS